MTAQIIIAIIYFAIIFPIFLTVKVSVVSETKCAYFGIFVFKWLRIVDGIAGIEEGKIFYVINGKKEVVKTGLLKNMKTKVKPLMDYHVLRLDNLLILGNNQIITPFVVGQAIKIICSTVFFSALIKKPYLKLSNEIFIYDDKKFVNDFLSFTVVFNVLMIIISLLKIITEKIINAIKQRKSGKLGSRNFA